MKTWLKLAALGTGLAAFQFARLAARGVDEWTRPPRVRMPDTPGRWGLSHTDAEFASRDGVRLRGWFFDAKAPDGGAPRSAVIVCHGHGGDKSPHLNLVARFRAAGIPLLLFDFRNHGASDGDLTSLGYYERYDVLGAIDWLAARGMTRIGLLGFSMGAATALATAPLSEHVVCVVSDSAFAHLPLVLAGAVSRESLPRALTGALVRAMWRGAGRRLHCPLEEADPLDAVRRFGTRPLLLIHGTRDEYIGPEQAVSLRDAASGPVRLWMVEGAGHTRIEHMHPDMYYPLVMGFFQEHLEA